ncbi:MAG: hypothetical protein JF603_03930 [Acidobacteria bacterium]|nr:hypothetical protein [Acidobacteriota bacterium]
MAQSLSRARTVIRVEPVVERAHAAAAERGDDTYVDPATGFDVFTAAFLLTRGHCCDNRCRHCPYDD